jgi:HAE1 family hydrophobic/amphiphilic exporter-1
VSLPSFSIRQSVLVNVLFFVCMAAGFLAYTRTPVDFFPDISFNATMISTLWTGASAEEVERLVTTKIEEEIADITGIDEIRSYSRADFSEILVEWDETLSEAEYESALNDLRAAVDRVTDLPADAEEPLIRELSVGEVQAVLMVAVVDVAGVGERAILDVARDAQSRLEDVPGVNKVLIRGEHEREVRVLVDRDAAARYGLTVVEIADRIRRKNLNLPAGTFTGPAGEATLRATGDYRSVEEMLQTVVRERADGSHVRLREVAYVQEGLEKRRYYGRYNGDPALVLSVAKRGDAHILKISERVDVWLDDYRRLLPEGIEVHKTWDTSEWVRSSMGVLWDNLVTGIFLVMGILWFTIGFRNATLTIIAIPFSFLTALIMFPLLDITINMMSLAGMLLVSGMLVDDAIIVLENIYRRIEEGEPLHQAVVRGAEEVMWPVLAAVATTAAAFVPLLFVTGTSGEFMSILPKTVIVCLIASLFECLLILPAHYLDLGSRHRPGERLAAAAPARGLLVLARRVAAASDALHVRVDRGLDALRRAYLRALDFPLRHRFSFGCLGIAVYVAALGLATHLDVDMFPSQYSNFFVVFEAPKDFGLEQTDRVFRGVEGEIDTLVGDPLRDYSSYVGLSLTAGMDARWGSNVAIVYAMITDTEEHRVHPEHVLNGVQQRLEQYRARQPAGIVDLRAMAPRNGPPIGKPVAVRIQADDYLLAKSIAREIQDYLRTLPGVSSIEDNLTEGPREVRLILDAKRAGQHGLTFEDAARALRGANDGLVASSFRDPAVEDDVDIRVLLEPRFRSDISGLLQTEIRESVNRDLAVQFADIAERYPEVEVVYGGEFQAQSEAFADMQRLYPIALLLIYMILAAQFRSYSQPLIVLTAIPFGLIGVIGGVWILGYKVSFPMLYATIGMSGVVVNDSLVMVDFVNRARRDGMPLLEAVRRAGAVRLRPILLTTLTTVLALLPMALGLRGTSKTHGPFAVAIAFGLMAAMIGTLFAVPLAYTSLISMQQRLGRLTRARRSPGSEGPGAPTPDLPPTAGSAIGYDEP